MQNVAYATFLRHLPQGHFDSLAIKTLGGTEILIQTILRVDHEFVALKGRLAATQDAGRVFFIPYRQIDHLFYQKEVKDEEFSAVYDSLRMPDPGMVPPPASAEAPAVAEAAIEPEPPQVPVNRPTPVPIKSAVLERFRARSSASANGLTNRPSSG